MTLQSRIPKIFYHKRKYSVLVRWRQPTIRLWPNSKIWPSAHL